MKEVEVEIQLTQGYYFAVRKYSEGKRPPSRMPGYEVCEEIVASQNTEFNKIGIPPISDTFIKEFVACNGNGKVVMEMYCNNLSAWALVDADKTYSPSLDPSGNAILRFIPEDRCTNYKRHRDVANLCQSCKDKQLTYCEKEVNPTEEAPFEFLSKVRKKLSELSGHEYILANLKQAIALYVYEEYKAGWKAAIEYINSQSKK